MNPTHVFLGARRRLVGGLAAAALTGLAALSVPAQAQTFTNSQLAGTYTITNGVNNDGTKYDGKVRLTPDASGGVTVRWDDNSVGVGMIEGNRLFIGMTFERRSVVMAMTFSADGRTATGRWILRTEPGVGIEEWRKD
jgi:hypothetical protein